MRNIALLNKIKEQRYGYVTIHALKKIVSVGMYYNQWDESLIDLNPLSMLYFEITDDTCFVMGYESEYGDALTFGLTERSTVAESDGKEVVLSIF